MIYSSHIALRLKRVCLELYFFSQLLCKNVFNFLILSQISRVKLHAFQFIHGASEICFQKIFLIKQERTFFGLNIPLQKMDHSYINLVFHDDIKTGTSG